MKSLDSRTKFEKEITGNEQSVREITRNPEARRIYQRELLRLDLSDLVMMAMEETLIEKESLLEHSGVSESQFNSFMGGEECDITIGFDLLSAMGYLISLTASSFVCNRGNDRLPKII